MRHLNGVFFLSSSTKSFVGDSNSLQNLPNIAKASFLDPGGFFVSFHAVFIKAFSFWRPAMNRGDN